MENELVFIGMNREGLKETQELRDQHATKLATRIGADVELVKDAMRCDREWPTKD